MDALQLLFSLQYIPLNPGPLNRKHILFTMAVPRVHSLFLFNWTQDIFKWHDLLSFYKVPLKLCVPLDTKHSPAEETAELTPTLISMLGIAGLVQV